MKFILKIIAILLTLVVVLGIAALAIFKTQVPTLASFFVDKKTNYPAKIESFDSKLVEGTIDANNISISNPPSFPHPTFIDINQVKVDLDLDSLNKEVLIIEEVIVDIDKIGYITDTEKNNNLKQFISAFQESDKTQPSEPETSPESPQEESEPEPFQFLIQRLVIRLNTIETANYANAADGTLKTYNAGIDLELTDVSDVKDIIKPLQRMLLSLGMEFLTNTLLDSFTAFDRLKLVNSLVEGDFESLSEDVTEKGKEILEKTLESGKENVDKAINEGLEKTNEIIKDFLNPINKKDESGKEE